MQMFLRLLSLSTVQKRALRGINKPYVENDLPTTRMSRNRYISDSMTNRNNSMLMELEEATRNLGKVHKCGR